MPSSSGSPLPLPLATATGKIRRSVSPLPGREGKRSLSAATPDPTLLGRSALRSSIVAPLGPVPLMRTSSQRPAPMNMLLPQEAAATPTADRDGDPLLPALVGPTGGPSETPSAMASPEARLRGVLRAANAGGGVPGGDRATITTLKGDLLLVQAELDARLGEVGVLELQGPLQGFEYTADDLTNARTINTLMAMVFVKLNELARVAGARPASTMRQSRVGDLISYFHALPMAQGAPSASLSIGSGGAPAALSQQRSPVAQRPLRQPSADPDPERAERRGSVPSQFGGRRASEGRGSVSESVDRLEAPSAETALVLAETAALVDPRAPLPGAVVPAVGGGASSGSVLPPATLRMIEKDVALRAAQDRVQRLERQVALLRSTERALQSLDMFDAGMQQCLVNPVLRDAGIDVPAAVPARVIPAHTIVPTSLGQVHRPKVELPPPTGKESKESREAREAREAAAAAALQQQLAGPLHAADGIAEDDPLKALSGLQAAVISLLTQHVVDLRASVEAQRKEGRRSTKVATAATDLETLTTAVTVTGGTPPAVPAVELQVPDRKVAMKSPRPESRAKALKGAASAPAPESFAPPSTPQPTATADMRQTAQLRLDAERRADAAQKAVAAAEGEAAALRDRIARLEDLVATQREELSQSATAVTVAATRQQHHDRALLEARHNGGAGRGGSVAQLPPMGTTLAEDTARATAGLNSRAGIRGQGQALFRAELTPAAASRPLGRQAAGLASRMQSRTNTPAHDVTAPADPPSW